MEKRKKKGTERERWERKKKRERKNTQRWKRNKLETERGRKKK